MKHPKTLILAAVILSGAVLHFASTPNKPFRTVLKAQCPIESQSADTINSGNSDNCMKAVIEQHEGFDLVFFEYSELGNAFNDQERVLKSREHIKKKVLEAKAANQSVTIAAYVHGWTNNAKGDNSNVIAFRKQLSVLHDTFDDQVVIGVYLGWRGSGLSILNLPVFELPTFWARKNAAETLGDAGALDTLLDLAKIDALYDQSTMITVGHSFGGAVVATAMHDILLSELNSSDPKHIPPLGDLIVLLNPAIEANRMLVLKETSMQVGYTEDIHRPRLLHVISSETDNATTLPFYLAQMLGSGLFKKHAKIQKRYHPYKGERDDYTADMSVTEPFTHDEAQLLYVTIGNYPMYLTGRWIDSKSAVPHSEKSQDHIGQDVLIVDPEYVRHGDQVDFQIEDKEMSSWTYESYCNENSEKMPCSDNDPIAFIKVPGSFINGHSDIFNFRVNAYLAAAISELNFKKAATTKDDKFDFASSFTSFLHDFGVCEAKPEACQKNNQPNAGNKTIASNDHSSY